MNAFTIDFEDWYQGVELPFTDWPQYEKRVEIGFYKIMEMLEAKNVKATWFTLGWIAENYPHLIKELHAAGHELASHGYKHDLAYRLSPAEFKEDVYKTKSIIEDLTGTPIQAYRAPFFSITAANLWALNILAETGYTIDCSVSPIKTWRYGISNCPDKIFHLTDAGITLFPISPFNALAKRWAIGGAYFRLLPYSLTKNGFEKRIAKKQYTMFYIHPWEYDETHPKINIDRKTKFTHYTNLRKTVPNTFQLLNDFKFDTVSNVIAHYKNNHRFEQFTTKILQS